MFQRKLTSPAITTPFLSKSATRLGALGAAALIILIALGTGCRSSSSVRPLDRRTAKKLLQGVTVDMPWIRIPAGLNYSTFNSVRAPQAFRRLQHAGILQCAEDLTECRIGPRGKDLTDEETLGIRVTIGFLVAEDVFNVIPLDEGSAKAEVTLRFQPTPTYRRFRSDLLALSEAQSNVSALRQIDGDALASVLFRHDQSGWRADKTEVVRRTGTAVWRTAQPESQPPAPVFTNLARLASLEVSSENSPAGQSGVKAIDEVVEAYPGDSTKEWATSGEQAGAWLKLTWPAPVQAWAVILYDRPSPETNILGGTLLFSDGTRLDVRQLPNDGSPFRLDFSPKSITWVQFTITSAIGPSTGLAEIQVLGSSP